MTKACIEEPARSIAELEKRHDGEFPLSQGACKPYKAWGRRKETTDQRCYPGGGNRERRTWSGPKESYGYRWQFLRVMN